MQLSKPEPGTSLSFPSSPSQLTTESCLLGLPNFFWILPLLSTPHSCYHLVGLLPKTSVLLPCNLYFTLKPPTLIVQRCKSHYMAHLSECQQTQTEPGSPPWLSWPSTSTPSAYFSSLGSCHTPSYSKLVAVRYGCTLGSPGQLVKSASAQTSLQDNEIWIQLVTMMESPRALTLAVKKALSALTSWPSHILTHPHTLPSGFNLNTISP